MTISKFPLYLQYTSVVCILCVETDPQTLQANCTDGQLRLVGGTSENEGRVEVCLSSTWGSICDDYWTREEASTVCRQLGFQPNGSI